MHVSTTESSQGKNTRAAVFRFFARCPSASQQLEKRELILPMYLILYDDLHAIVEPHRRVLASRNQLVPDSKAVPLLLGSPSFVSLRQV